MKIAIVKLSSLGDIIHSMVALQFIKKYHPESEIDWVVEEKYKGLLTNNPHLNAIHTVCLKEIKSWPLLLNEIRKIKSFGPYDVVIDAQGLIKSSVISRLIKCKKRVGFDRRSIRESLATFLYTDKVYIDYSKNTIDRMVELICFPIGVKVSRDQIINKSLFIHTSSRVKVPKSPYIVFVMGSTWENRNYPKEKFLRVANSLQVRCVVLWGNEQEKEKAFWMKRQSALIEIMPLLSIDELKYVIKNSSLLIGNDTGPTHMAWGLNTPSITLFGPTPVHRVYQTPINRTLNSSSKVDQFKLDRNDFTIKEIKVSNIVKISKELLRLSL
jgi:heptosyltransferase I